ncbi:MAG: hypothetical protein CME65_10595 [Halobacteriovoraceae bacterium]|nr:hypothetical protein [Halobacteriovoraceae bacterium]|tara:strand:+ start:4571 stop:5536 length:966 start_codon:yes stop_codon:yes gene_type:complete
MQKQTYSQILDLLELHKYFVVDKKIIQLYPKLANILDKKSAFLLDHPESCKSFEIYKSATEFFLDKGITRNDSLIAIGGGATSDLTGFIASTILRGIPWKVIPTTLLSMIDACIGGKTGINTTAGKNLIGAFHLPAEIFICKDFLETLPEEELISGKGELLKYLLLSRQIFDAFDGTISDELILKCAEYKNQLVTEDLHERGVRRLLNLGHTFGHAIEKSASLSHGRAVAIGTYWIIILYRPPLREEFKRLSETLKIDLKLEKLISKDSFRNFVLKDKKRLNQNELEIIVPANIGVSEVKQIGFEQLFSDLYQSELNACFK